MSIQIKNAVRTAQALAVNEKQPLCMTHIAKVLEVGEAFEKDLKGGTGYEGTLSHPTVFYSLRKNPLLVLTKSRIHRRYAKLHVMLAGPARYE